MVELPDVDGKLKLPLLEVDGESLNDADNSVGVDEDGTDWGSFGKLDVDASASPSKVDVILDEHERILPLVLLIKNGGW